MKRVINRSHLLPPGLALLTGIGVGISFFGFGHWEALPKTLAAFPTIGVSILVVALEASIARAESGFVRASAVFVGLLVAHCAVALGVLYATWVAFGLVFRMPSSP